MKKLMLLFSIFTFLALNEINAKPINISMNLDFFYFSLEPYGEWMVFDGDLIVWRPRHIGRDWRPYSDGRWSWTRHGWYWDSYEPYGWATYHYGRWFYDDYYGWIWIPDYEWGPSWVEWRYDDVYIGWAPLPPYAHFRIDFGIHFSINWNSHYSYWNFVGYDHFCHDRLNYYIVGSHLNNRIFERTKYRNNYSYDRGRIINGGIDRNYVERKTGYRISERDIYDVDDYGKYEKSRSSDSDRIYNYRPNEREIEKYSSKSNIEVKRGDKNLSIERDKIVYKNDAVYNERELNSSRDRDTKSINKSRDNVPGKEYEKDIKREKIDVNTPKYSNEREIKSDRNNVRNKVETKIETRNERIYKSSEPKREVTERKSSSQTNKPRVVQRDERKDKSSTERKIEKRR